MMCVTAELSAGEMFCSRLDSIGSSGQVVGRESSRILETSSLVIGENEDSVSLLVGSCRLGWSGSVNWLLIAETLSVFASYLSLAAGSFLMHSLWRAAFSLLDSGI